MEKKIKILVVDQDQTIQKFCHQTLDDGYEVACVDTHDEGIDRAKEFAPDIILIGLTSDEEAIRGLCQKLQFDPVTAASPILLLTEKDNIPDQIFCLDLGAYSIILKPLNPDAILTKLTLVTHRKKHEHKLTQEAKLATDTALSAMTGNSELGQAIRFVERSYGAASFEALADQLLSVMSALDLKAVLMFSTNTDAFYFANDAEVTPLEKQLITALHQEPGRFRDFGKRTVTKYSRVSLLVKNMPLDNPDSYGRFKDLFPSLLGAADARIKALDTETALLSQTNNTVLSFQQIRTTLENLADAYSDNQQQIMTVMRNMLTELDFKIPAMGLDEDQETYLVERIDRAIQEASDLLDQGENLNEAFRHISTLLDHLTTQLQQLVAEVTADKHELANEEDVVNEEPDDMGIELF